MQPETQQSDFARALTDPDADVPIGVVDPVGNVAPKRFATYRNNVNVSLIETMRSIFPAAEALIGAGPFRDAARDFIRSAPPRSPILAHYGDGFAGFLEADPRFHRWPFLPDVARLERFWLSAYHAADKAPLDPGDVAAVTEQQWPTARFSAHPASRLLESVHPVVDLWRAAREADATPRIDRTSEQWALIVRPAYAVSVLAIDPAQGPVIAALLDGVPLSESVMRSPQPDQLDLGGLMQNLLAAGAFSGMETDQ